MIGYLKKLGIAFGVGALVLCVCLLASAYALNTLPYIEELERLLVVVSFVISCMAMGGVYFSKSRSVAGTTCSCILFLLVPMLYIQITLSEASFGLENLYFMILCCVSSAIGACIAKVFTKRAAL